MISETELSALPGFWREMNDGPQSEVAERQQPDHFEIAMISEANDLFPVVVDLDGGHVSFQRFEKNRSWGICPCIESFDRCFSVSADRTLARSRGKSEALADN